MSSFKRKLENILEEKFPAIKEDGLKPYYYTIFNDTKLCSMCARDLFVDKPYLEFKQYLVEDEIICECCGEAVEE
jgi:hypothetical protein